MPSAITLSPSEKTKIKINQLRREWQAEMAQDIRHLNIRVTKLEKKKMEVAAI